jgi:hypothetical protein
MEFSRQARRRYMLLAYQTVEIFNDDLEAAGKNFETSSCCDLAFKTSEYGVVEVDWHCSLHQF